jgi:hypothetical protein
MKKFFNSFLNTLAKISIVILQVVGFFGMLLAVGYAITLVFFGTAALLVNLTIN